MKKFIWITDDYRINVDAIFSLQKINNDNELSQWKNKYNNFINNLESYPELQVSSEMLWTPTSGIKVDDEYINKYAEQFEIWAESQIGSKPKCIEQYILILCTGVKIIITKDKYEEINKVIDNLK